MCSSHHEFFWHGSHTMIEDEGDGGGGCGFVTLLFDGLSGGLVDLLLGFPYVGELSDRIATLHLPLSTMGLKWKFKKCMKLTFDRGIYKVTMERRNRGGLQRVFSYSR